MKRAQYVTCDAGFVGARGSRGTVRARVDPFSDRRAQPPNGRIPVLQDGDVTLFESLAINLYLARKYGPALWPKSVADEGRAYQAYQWSIWAMTELEEPIITALMHRAFLPADQRVPAKADEAAERFKKPLAVLDGALAGQQCLDDGTLCTRRSH
jgi:glutathione S-transferase